MCAGTPQRDPIILNVDDFEAGRYAITRILKRARFQVKEAATGTEALEMVAATHPDLVLLDVNLPDINGFEVCRRIKSDPATARIPVLHISASSIESAHQTLGFESGADNYLTEPVEPEVLLAAVRAALRGRHAEESMRRLAAQWQATFDAMGDGVALLDTEGRILRWNRKLETLLGRRPEQISRHYCYRLWDRAGQQPEKQAFLTARESRRREEMDVKSGGRWLHVTVDPMLDETTGEFQGAVYVVADTTERRTLEEQFREAQKFESIGQLAAGVAHDFNNLLTSILGNASLVLGDLDTEHPLRESVEEIAAAGNRAAELTRQLLAYSGKAPFLLKPVSLGRVIAETESLLRSSVTKRIDLEFQLDPDIPLVEADPAQIRQVLLNVVINAAEAIADAEGRIRVAAGGMTVAETGRGLKPGPHAYLDVQDNGCGMNEHVRAHLFEPFFTTKFMGRGLGMAAVAGIVRGHSGAIQVESVPGRGTTLRIVLPAAVETVRESPPAIRSAAAGRTVLIVDDEPMVRRMAKVALETRGYQVLLAENGREAVEIVRRDAARIDAVLLDMTMPVMSGAEALEGILRLAPHLKVIGSTGYTEREAARQFGPRIAGFLQKPYTSRQLGERISKLFAAAAGETGGPA